LHPTNAAIRIACGGVLAAYLTLVVIPACRHPDTNGFAAYYTAARILVAQPRDLSRVYDNLWFQDQVNASGFVGVRDIHNTQPPTMSLMMAPLAWMSPSNARVVWVSLGVVLWLGGLALLCQGLGLAERQSAIHPLLLSAALTTAYVPLCDNFRQGQCYTLLFFLLCVFMRLLCKPASKRDWIAGIPLGAIAVVKLAGLWLWPLLLLSRRRRVLLGAAGTTACIGVLALPVVGWGAWRPFFHDLPRLSSDPVRYLAAYQTLTSLMGHLFIFDARWNPHPAIPMRPLGVALPILLGATVLILSARVQRLDGEGRDERVLSLAMLLAPIVSAAPIAESYHYVLVLPSLLTAVWWATVRRVAVPARATLALAAALLIVPSRLYTAHVLDQGWLALFAYPRLYGAFILWGWLALALVREGTEVERSRLAAQQRQP